MNIVPWLGALAYLSVARVQSTPSQTSQPPVLISFSISDSVKDRSLALLHKVSGTVPSHYRVSERADFAGASWAPYDPAPRWRGALSGLPACPGRGDGGNLRLYFQVRAPLGQEVRIVRGQRQLVPAAAESNVLVDSICVSR